MLMSVEFGMKYGVKIQLQNIPLPFEQNVLAKWATGVRPDLLLWHGIGNWLVQLNPDNG